ncbi:branched-chain amino acid ABC transporter permease [Actinophytocola sp.]|uniref:branched-chain amino acid ABC transporter permease n=1 Tax=Actinophytocola sp. TaxID=1872138 RepID=UPI0025BC374E|nr:branched-chain amino acid ABC transporter permease [Actinophytocola sp.]
MMTKPLWYPVGLAVALLCVQFAARTTAELFLVALMAIYALAALGLNIIFGVAGLLSVAQAAVMAFGGYTSALLMVRLDFSFLAALPAAAVASALLSAFAGLAALRVGSHYFILVTLGVAEAALLVMINEEQLTGGYNGLVGIPPLSLAGVDMSSSDAVATVSIVALFIGWYVANAMRASRFGSGAAAAGADPQLAMACGVDVPRQRVLASAAGGAFAGVAGALFAEALQFLGPGDFGVDKALLLLLIVVIGGAGSNGGTVLAAIMLTYLSQGLLTLTTVGPLVYGLGIMVILVFVPRGLAGLAGTGRRVVAAIARRERRQ